MRLRPVNSRRLDLGLLQRRLILQVFTWPSTCLWKVSFFDLIVHSSQTRKQVSASGLLWTFSCRPINLPEDCNQASAGAHRCRGAAPGLVISGGGRCPPYKWPVACRVGTAHHWVGRKTVGNPPGATHTKRTDQYGRTLIAKLELTLGLSGGEQGGVRFPPPLPRPFCFWHVGAVG